MRWNVSDVSPSNERRRKGENKDRGLRIFLGSQLSARLGCTGWGYSHLSGCLCMSVSRQGSSTVCNHGNHKDVAPTIKRRWWHIIQMPHTRTRNHPPSIIAREEVTQPCVPERPPGKVTFVVRRAENFCCSPADEAAPPELFEFNALLKGS